MIASSSIFTLLLAIGPAAIIGIVALFVVISFNGEFRSLPINSKWTPAHILKEIEVIIPARANSNSSTSIVFPAWMFRIIASLSHVFPCSIFRRDSFPVSKYRVVSSFSILETSAAFCSSFLEFTRTNARQFAALASTNPSWLIRGIILSSANYSEQSERMSSQIFKQHDMDYTPCPVVA